MMNPTSWLDQSAAALDSGLAAQAAGRLDEARRHYLDAAEALFNAAKQSKGDLKAKRIAQAEDLLARAEALSAKAETPPAKGAPSKPEPATATDDKVAEWLVAERPNVRFDDVAGLDDVKEQIRLKLIYPFAHPDKAKKFGVKSGGGILLYGPPGTGKTLIARAVAGEVEAAFFSVKPSEIMSKWVGEAEQNVQKLFKVARSHPRAVIFIDEVESLVPKRRDSGSTVMQRVVPQILAELEGFERSGGALLFIGATNEPWSLDPAVMRPGRFDEKVYIPLPDFAARRRILEINLKDRPLAAEVRFDDLAQLSDGYSGADVANLCRKACAIPFIESIQTGVDRDVERRDFESVIAQVKPSVNPKELARYEKFAKTGE